MHLVMRVSQRFSDTGDEVLCQNMKYLSPFCCCALLEVLVVLFSKGAHMSTFRVTVETLKISPHPNADRLELAQVGDYLSIVPKGHFQDGDLAAYIPEASIVPESILEELGLVGKLAGSQKNRVRAMKLRGILSQGICLAARPEWSQGDDVAEELGIIKYEPAVPSHMSGELYGAGHDRCIRYDIESFKRYPGVIEEGEQVVMTEKIHGTWCQLGVVPAEMAHPEYGQLVVASKGLGHKGLAFKPDAEANVHNLYVQMAKQLDFLERFSDVSEPLFVLGEIFGAGVQDLHYSESPSGQARSSKHFRVFDVYRGVPGQGEYLGDEQLDAFCALHNFERVPVVWRGPFSKETLREHTTGRECVSGKALHMREGVVVRTVEERRDDEIGRVQLKSVSEDYLLRKGGTEYN